MNAGSTSRCQIVGTSCSFVARRVNFHKAMARVASSSPFRRGSSFITRQLDYAFVRLMIHDAERNPIDATNRRRHPTTRQKRVVMEAHNNECVDCSSTNLIEFDHNPPYEQTHHTITAELEPRCAPCHRARHRTHHSAVA